MEIRGNVPSLQVRRADPEDAASIAAVLYQSFVEYRSAYTDQGFAATTPTPEQIQSRFNEGPIWVAWREDAIIGTVSVVPRGNSLYIRSMAVLPAARAKGIGRQLLEHVEWFAAAFGYERMFLCTTPFLTRAIRLYEQFGFRRGIEEDNLFGTPIFTMEKLVGKST